MKNLKSPKVAPIKLVDKIDRRAEEAAYRNWVERARTEVPADPVDDWIAAEQAAQKGFPDVPSGRDAPVSPDEDPSSNSAEPHSIKEKRS